MITLSDSTTISVLGDVHGKDWIVTRAIAQSSDESDLLVQVGDFWCYSKKQLKNISYNCKRYNKSLVFLPGNHEDWDKLDAYSTENIMEIYPRIYYAPIGSRAIIGGKTVQFIGGAVSIDKKLRTVGVDWFPQETISMKQYHHIVANHRENVDVVFAHDCPLDVVLPPLEFHASSLPSDIDYQCGEHRRLLQDIVNVVQPSLLIHGHYHSYYNHHITHFNYATRVIGVGEENCYGAHLTVDLSVMSHEVVDSSQL